MRTFLSIAILVALAVPASAQVLSAKATAGSNPVPSGGIVSLEVEATQNVDFLTGCGILNIRSGSPTGPIVFSPVFCPFIFITVGPGTPYTVGWNQMTSAGTLAPPGLYFIEVGGIVQAGGYITSSHFPVRIDPAVPTEPVLTINNPLTRGQTSTFTVTNGPAFAPFFFFASFTTNVGIPVGGFAPFALDQDFLFQLSLNQDPGLFSGLVGALDANGATSFPAMHVPSFAGVPGFLGLPVAFQVLVLDPLDLTVLIYSNPITTALD